MRLFVAISLPAAIKKRLISVQGGSEEVTDLPFIADRFILYESLLKRTGAVHREVMSYPAEI